MTTQARSLKLSVGKKGKNLENDVKVVQHLLNLALRNNPRFKAAGIATLVEYGDCGDLTEAAIVAYQEKVLGWSGPAVDGTVEPNKTTWKSLNGNVGDPAKVKRAVVVRFALLEPAYGGFCEAV